MQSYRTYPVALFRKTASSLLDFQNEFENKGKHEAINEEIARLRNETNPNARALRQMYRLARDPLVSNTELAERMRSDIANQQGVAVPKFNESAPYKRNINSFQMRMIDTPLNSSYNPYTNTMSISHTDKNDVATIAHEYGHAVDPVQDSYENANRRNPNIPRSIGARSDEYYNLVNREMNGSENGRRMLRDGYGQPDVIARRTYDGVPSYTSYAYENLRDSMSAGYPLRDSKRGFWQDAYGAYGNKPFIKSFPEHTPENNSIMYEFADYLGRTPEAIARKFTEGISSPDPIKRHLLVREALNNARYVDMSKFVNDATAHAAFMPKLPAATPSGTPSTGWQPVRNNSVYLDKK